MPGSPRSCAPTTSSRRLCLRQSRHARYDPARRAEVRRLVTSDWARLHGTDFINDGADLEMPGRGSDIASFYAGVPAVVEPPGPLSGPSPPYHIPEETRGRRAGTEARGSQPIGLSAALRQGSVTEDTITQQPGACLRQLQRFGISIARVIAAARLPTGQQSPATIAGHAAVLRRTPARRGAAQETKAVPCRCRGRNLAAVRHDRSRCPADHCRR